MSAVISDDWNDKFLSDYVDWLTAWMTKQASNQLTNELIDWLTDWQAGILTE